MCDFKRYKRSHLLGRVDCFSGGSRPSMRVFLAYANPQPFTLYLHFHPHLDGNIRGRTQYAIYSINPLSSLMPKKRSNFIPSHPHRRRFTPVSKLTISLSLPPPFSYQLLKLDGNAPPRPPHTQTSFVSRMFRKRPDSLLSILVAYARSNHGTLMDLVRSGGGVALHPTRSNLGCSVRYQQQDDR